MPQFFLPQGAVEGRAFRLAGPEARHALKVLRLGEGASLELFDGRGRRYRGIVARVHEDGSLSGSLEELARARAAPVRLSLCAALLKGPRWEWLLEKACELGVDRVVPVVTERTVIRLEGPQRVRAKEERWRRVLLAAAKQCGRAELPRLEGVLPLREALRRAAAQGPALFAWEGLAGTPASGALRVALSGGRSDPAEGLRVSLFTGPEGGFSAEEAESARGCGAVRFGLGPNTLRGETAAVVAAALVLYEAGAWGDGPGGPEEGS